MSNAFIRPYRIIPFDIGGDISCEECEKIVEEYNAVAEDKIQIQPIDKFHRSLSDKLICGYKINDSLLLFIYSYGVGVFSVILFSGLSYMSKHDLNLLFCYITVGIAALSAGTSLVCAISTNRAVSRRERP